MAGFRPTSRRVLAKARGLTLVEILVTLSVVLTVLVAIYSVFESSESTYAVGEVKAAIQQEARVVMGLMARDLRLAGYGFPTGANAIAAASATSITFWADLTDASTRLSGDVNPGATTLSVESVAGIQPGDTIFLISGGQWEQLTVSAVNAGVTPNNITVNPAVATFYPWPSSVGRPTSVTHCWNDIDGSPGPPACGSGATTLFKDAGEGGGWEALAEGVQSFQFRYFDADEKEILPPIAGGDLANIRRITIDVEIQSPPGSRRPQTFTIGSAVRVRNL